MICSFCIIEMELKNCDILFDWKWVLLYVIYMIVDFEMECLFYIDFNVVVFFYDVICIGNLWIIVIDVMMVVFGICKGVL